MRHTDLAHGLRQMGLSLAMAEHASPEASAAAHCAWPALLLAPGRLLLLHPVERNAEGEGARQGVRSALSETVLARQGGDQREVAEATAAKAGVACVPA